MSGSVADRKRLVRLTAENLRDRSISLSPHEDFFRADGAPPARPLKVLVEGIVDPVRFKPRRDDSGTRIDGEAVGRFFSRHDFHVGDILSFEKVGQGLFRLSSFESKTVRDSGMLDRLDLEPEGPGPTVLELFAGCGGMALGFKNAGFRTVLAVEWDAAACETLRANITDRVAQCAIQEIDRFPKADVIAGGPPCQGFSNLGEKVPDDPRNQLWVHYLRAVEQASPVAFVMENVPPLLKSMEFQEIKRRANELGYQVEGRVLNAADHGVPQTRKRAIVIGLRGEAPRFPEPSHSPSNWITVRQAIGDIPFEPNGENWHVGRNPTPMSLARYRHVPPGGNRWDLPPELTPDCWKRKTKGGTDLFGRLWWDRPSVTIRTEFYKPEKGRYLHPEADRPITHREAARLQGFPDDFRFVGSKTQVGVQIGNACPPPLATRIARRLAESLALEKTKASGPSV